MLITTALVATLLSQPFEVGPTPLDVSEVKASLRAVTDGKQHYVVFQQGQPLSGWLFYGDGKTFYRLRSPGGGGSGDESFGLTLWDPRFGPVDGHPSFDMKRVDTDGGTRATYSTTCGQRTTALTEVPAAEWAKMLETAAFKGPLWTRLPLRLLRNDEGVYFLVDILRTDNGSHQDHRVFKGPRGSMKLQPLKNVVDDSEGMILATRDGQLRLVAGSGNGADAKKHLKWVKGKSETQLIEVPIEGSNAALIYNELGPYDGQRLGTPCDDLR